MLLATIAVSHFASRFCNQDVNLEWKISLSNLITFPIHNLLEPGLPFLLMSVCREVDFTIRSSICVTNTILMSHGIS